MRWQEVARRVILLLVVFLAAESGPLSTKAQAQDGDGETPTVAGVIVDADGVLRKQTYLDRGGQLTRQRIAASRMALAPEVTRYSALRMISLNRLEKAVQRTNASPTDEMRYLAGLLRVKYVFYYPDTHDVVIAGPAEGWFTNAVGRVVGITSRRPVVQLQDLIVALRAFPPGGHGSRAIGCSIDPTQEGLAGLQRFLRAVGSYATPADTPYIIHGLKTSLGLQTVSINGVPPDTHFAQILVEADYRMKLIGIGLERPPVRMVSFVDRASPTQVSQNALVRWYFVPDYQCVRVSEDGLAMELVGDGVKLVGADELVTSDGIRRAASGGSVASQAFVTSFTKLYPELAEQSPVFAELRNLIDLAIAAAHIQRSDLYRKAGWDMDLFGDERAYSVQTYNAPQRVESAVNAVWKRSRLMTPIGGGVRIEAETALDPANLLDDEQGKVASLRNEARLELAEGQWWWDAP